MIKALFWFIVAVCALCCFPVAVGSIVVLMVILFVVFLVALLTKDRREMKAERKREEALRCELLERAKIRKEKEEAEARAAEEEHRAQAERVAKYNRLAKEAAAAGDLEDAECWRRLAVAELDKYTNKSTNRF